MNEAFEISVNHKGEELLLPAEFIVLQNVYRIRIDINGNEIAFEPDEERKFRAVMNPKNLRDIKIEANLLKAIAERLECACEISFG